MTQEIQAAHAVPEYQAGAHAALERDDALAIMDRLAAHLRDGTTDMAPQQRRIPISDYRDEARWEREMETIFRRIPLPVALSAELPNPGDFKALRVCGRQVLLVRGRDGRMRAHANVCRHRAMQLVPEGCGSARRFSCSYHGWTYDTDGALVGVPAENTFGDVDRASHSLLSLPCEERAGIVFAGLTRGMEFDIDAWLGDALPLLERLELDRCTHFTTKTLAGPNWKVTLDGYLEGYHFATLHPQTVFLTNHSNRATFDPLGPHVRNVFALKTLDDEVTKPREEWDPAATLGLVYWLFPGMSIAGGLRQRTVVSIMLPGDSWGESMTWQTTLLRHPPQSAEELAEAERTAEWFFAAFRDEDYTAQGRVQAGLASADGTEMVIGRNEIAVQYTHDTIERLLAGQPVHGPREWLGR